MLELLYVMFLTQKTFIAIMSNKMHDWMFKHSTCAASIFMHDWPCS